MLFRPLVRMLAAAAVFTVPVLCQGSDPKAGDTNGNGPPAWTLSNGQKGPSKDDQKRAVTERSLSGFVTDAEGKTIEGAVVQLKNTRTLQVRSFLTRDKGDYYFSGLSKDVDYELKAQSKGKTSSSKTLSSFDSKATPVINLQIK
jgi:hypothetical protein